jgi:iron complex outermembrane receptor protein
MMRNPLVSVLSSAMLLAPGVALAQIASQPAPQSASNDPVGLEEIIVTGTKTGAQALQEAPISVSVVGGDLLRKQGLNNMRDLANYVPNVSFAQNTSAAILYIRGIGSNNAYAGSDPDVTTQIDGVYIARPNAQQSDFLDVERIEVLRGPQGTLYGRNAVGGTINIISRAPAKEFGGEARLTYGNYNTVVAEGYLSGPVAGDKLRASLALNYRSHDAYFDNIVPGAHDAGDANRGGARFQLRWEPTDNIDATTRADYLAVDEHFESFSNLLAPVAFSAPLANSIVGDYRSVAINYNQTLHQRIGGVSEEVNWNLGDGLSLKSITAWRQVGSRVYNDNEATEIAFTNLKSEEKESQFSQELNLQVLREGFRGVAGVYYFGDKDQQISSLLVPPSVGTPAPAAFGQIGQPIIKTDSFAAFAQAVVEIVPKLSLTIGARYTTEKKTLNQYMQRYSLNPATLNVPTATYPRSFDLSRHDNAFTPKIGLDYQITDDALAYVSVTRGYKSGGFNYSAASTAIATFNPEGITSYEAGVKTEWLNRRLRLNATGFYYDYSDLQVQALVSAGVISIVNAADAKVKGIEFEVVAKPASVLQLSGNFSLLDAKYGDFNNASVPGAYVRFVSAATCVQTPPAPATCTLNASGHRLNGAPKYSGLVAADLTPTIGNYKLTIHLDYTWRARTYYDASNIPLASQGAYGLLNANLGFGPDQDHGWRAEAYAKNIADEGYYMVVSGAGSAPAGAVGDPRTFGVRLLYNW